MRVLYANNHLYRRGGCERVMFDEAASVMARGHETLFFGHRHADAEGFPFASLFPERVDYTSVRGFGKVRAAARIVYNAGAGRRVAELLRAAKPDLMHCHNIYAGLTPAILDAAAANGVPTVLTLHDYKLACPSYLLLRRGKACDACVGRSFLNCLARRCHKESWIASAVTTFESTFNERTGKWSRAHLYVCPSRFLRSVMLRHGLPEEKLRHVPNGIDLEQWPAGSDGEGYALYVGRLSPEKDVETLVRASIGVQLPVRVVGEGPDAERLETLASALGADVRFEGQKSAAELQALLRGAAFLVVPSVASENAPMTIIEAMASGKPVIATRIGGIPELVEDGVTGLLVPPGGVEQLREAMRGLAAAATRRREMGRAARARAEAEFSLRVHADRLLALYEEALAA